MAAKPANVTTAQPAKVSGSWLTGLFKGFGEYPPEYNCKIHGPYNPGMYYGKPDTSIGDVKLGELPAWLMRRNYSPRAMLQCYMRAQWRWAIKYLLPKKTGLLPVIHVAVAGATISYFLQYDRHKNERHAKYH